jgi:hypothetical protein
LTKAWFAKILDLVQQMYHCRQYVSVELGKRLSSLNSNLLPKTIQFKPIVHKLQTEKTINLEIPRNILMYFLILCEDENILYIYVPHKIVLGL